MGLFCVRPTKHRAACGAACAQCADSPSEGPGPSGVHESAWYSFGFVGLMDGPPGLCSMLHLPPRMGVVPLCQAVYFLLVCGPMATSKAFMATEAAGGGAAEEADGAGTQGFTTC